MCLCSSLQYFESPHFPSRIRIDFRAHALCEVRTEALPINKGCFRKLEAWYNRIYAGESQGCREALASSSEVWAPNRVKKYIVAALRVTCNTYAHMGEITYMMKGLLDNCRLGR